MDEAGVRIHGTTREQPLERFARRAPAAAAAAGDRPGSGHLASRASCTATATSSSTARCYSVPFALVGKRLWLRATDTRRRDLRGLPARRHPPARAASPASGVTVRDHLPPEAQAFFARDRHWCVAAGRRDRPGAAPSSSSSCSPIASSSGCAPRKACCAWPRRYGAARLEAACARALVPRQPLLPHRQDHPRRRLRPAAAAAPPASTDRLRHAARASRATPQPVRLDTPDRAALTLKEIH